MYVKKDLQKRPTKETYKRKQHKKTTQERERICVCVSLSLSLSLFLSLSLALFLFAAAALPNMSKETYATDQKKETCKRELLKRPTKETYKRDLVLRHHQLQYAATHCNTLQHTATYCNTLQHTATHCNTLQHNVMTHMNEMNESWHI